MPIRSKQDEKILIEILRLIDLEIIETKNISKELNITAKKISSCKLSLKRNGFIMKSEVGNDWYLTDAGDYLLKYGYEGLKRVPAEPIKLNVLHLIKDGEKILANELKHCAWLRENNFATKKSRKAQHELTELGILAVEAESIYKFIKESD